MCVFFKPSKFKRHDEISIHKKKKKFMLLKYDILTLPVGDSYFENLNKEEAKLVAELF